MSYRGGEVCALVDVTQIPHDVKVSLQVRGLEAREQSSPDGIPAGFQ